MAFWRQVVTGVASGDRALLIAEDADGMCGTVQLVFDLPENQPHRGDLVGDIPRYAPWPQGGFRSTTVFYRDLAD